MALPDSAEAGPLLPTLSQIHSWRTTHLVTAAEHWNAAAKSWENSYTAVYQAVQQPGGQPWEGDAAHAALNRAHSDRTKVLLAVDNLNFAPRVGVRDRTLDVGFALSTARRGCDWLRLCSRRPNG
jgi:hypothetical protein